MRLTVSRWIEKVQEKFLKVTDSNKLSKDELEFLPAALEVVQTPPSPIGRATAWVLIGVFTIAIIWSCVGQVDEVSIAPGKVIPSGYTKTVQADDKGMVKAILVKDGSKVQQGDLIIELDTTFTAADLARLLKDQAFYQLEIQRLIAEQTGQPFTGAMNSSADPQDIQNQFLLYQSRTAEFQSKIAAAQQAVNQSRVAIDVAEATKLKLAMQLEIVLDQESKMQILTEQGAVSIFQYQAYKEKRIGLQQDLASQASEIVKAQYSLLQSMETLNNVLSERDRDIMTKLVEDRRQLQATEEELKKAKEKNRLSHITAPISGTVHQLAVHTVGAVVTPAQQLAMIVPEGTAMEIEAWIPNKDIGFIHEGQDAEIKVETFSFQKYGTLEAKLVELSSDAVEDKEKGGLVYRAILRATPDYFTLANDRKVYISPGMAVTSEIKTRQKRIIEYFMDPFIKYRSEGLRER